MSSREPTFTEAPLATRLRDASLPLYTKAIRHEAAERIEIAEAAERRLLEERDQAEQKAWDARYKFVMFGYWAGVWVHVNRLCPTQKSNPWRDLVSAARLANLGIETRPFFVLSTGHVSEATAQLLDKNAEYMGGGQYGNYGWFLYCSEEQNTLPDDLFVVMAYARSHGVDYVLFDKDADRIEGLPFYEW